MHEHQGDIFYPLNVFHHEQKLYNAGAHPSHVTHLTLTLHHSPAGTFYLQSNKRTVAAMQLIAKRLAVEKTWDQVLSLAAVKS